VHANIQVWWQDEGAWFTGSVASYDTNSGKHVVDYDDGDGEELDMAQEKYEILPGENVTQQLPV
jgi:DNA mismatch repair protein MSH6